MRMTKARVNQPRIGRPPVDSGTVSLVRAFFARFESRAEALNYINERLGTSYKHGAFSRWDRREREPGPETRRVMMEAIMPRLLTSYKHGKMTVEEVLEQLL